MVFRSKKSYVYHTLHEQILHGELKPGTRLVIQDISDALNVSIIPVREALQLLEADGYVTIEPYVGATVTQIDQDSAMEVFQLLEAMEIISGRIAAQKMTKEQFAEMARLLETMDQAIDDYDQWSELNMSLHQFICDCANTQLVKTLLSRVIVHWDRLRRFYLQDVFSQSIQRAQQEHWELYDTLCKRDPDLVERVVRAHNQRALANYLQQLQTEDKESKSLNE